jgi:ankyrin repeat protein
MTAHSNSGSPGDCVALLCDFAAETVDLVDKESHDTPLHTAAGSGAATCVRVLLETVLEYPY